MLFLDLKTDGTTLDELEVSLKPLRRRTARSESAVLTRISLSSLRSSKAVNFMSGVMGLANAERSLTYIRTIAEFISQPEIKDVVPM